MANTSDNDLTHKPLLTNPDGSENYEGEKRLTHGLLWGAATGTLAAIATSMGLHIKLRPFNQELNNKVRDDVMSRGGGLGVGWDDRRFGSTHYNNMIMGDEKWSFVKKLDSFGGQGMVSLLVGGAVGLATTGIYWLATAGAKKVVQNKDGGSVPSAMQSGDSVFKASNDNTADLEAENAALKKELSETRTESKHWATDQSPRSTDGRSFTDNAKNQDSQTLAR